MTEAWIEKLAIQELCARYCQTIDSRDSLGWAQCFTRDGVFEFDGEQIRGHEALRRYADVHTRVLRSRHMTVNHLYEVDGDAATGLSTTVVAIATEGGYRIMGQAVYRDELVKETGQWRLRARRFHTVRLVVKPDMAINLARADRQPPGGRNERTRSTHGC